MKGWTSFKGGPRLPLSKLLHKAYKFQQCYYFGSFCLYGMLHSVSTHIIFMTSFSFNVKKVDNTNLVPRVFLFKIGRGKFKVKSLGNEVGTAPQNFPPFSDHHVRNVHPIQMIEEFHIEQIFHPPLLLHLDIQFIEAAETIYSCHWIRAGKYQTLRQALVILFCL